MSNSMPKEIANDLMTLLFEIHNKLFKFNEIGKNDVFPPSHIKTIFYLHHKKSVSISDIAKCLDISKSNMTPIIDKLIEEDFVERFNDPNDRRKINVQLTEKGENFIKEKLSDFKCVLSNKISILENHDLEHLGELIKDMQNIIIKLK
ncbi:MarR family winged helix-turn-helix transcriptional regulator [Clostridium nigeriense]|uniref:MarR family winged helix-turn-helix transcriptional regulator n=1 Tax=Clostridium nigeriense TaxID=1805470 RepID=UPI003D32E311